MSGANPLRGEAALAIGGIPHVLRPSFSALVAAEEELGPLFALVERAGSGQLRLSEMAALFWHCLAASGRPGREEVGEAVIALGLTQAAKPLRVLLHEILKGPRMSERFADGALSLAGLVPRLLGWAPDAFWSATPSELAAILAPECSGASAPLSRSEFEQLMERDDNG